MTEEERDALVAADERGRMWDAGPPPPPRPPRVAVARGVGEHGDFLVDAAQTPEECLEAAGYEADPVTGEFRRATWTEV